MGLKGQPVCFIFTDSDVKDEAFLEYINQLLMTGAAGLGVVGYGSRAWPVVEARRGEERQRCR